MSHIKLQWRINLSQKYLYWPTSDRTLQTMNICIVVPSGLQKRYEGKKVTFILEISPGHAKQFYELPGYFPIWLQGVITIKWLTNWYKFFAFRNRFPHVVPGERNTVTWEDHPNIKTSIQSYVHKMFGYQTLENNSDQSINHLIAGHEETERG